MAAVMKDIEERPILMKGAMVRAILDGRKTQTRRIVKTDLRPQSKDTVMRGFPPNPQNVRMLFCYAKCDAPAGSRSVSYRVPCPYGRLGDRLFVKETFARVSDGEKDGICYRADRLGDEAIDREAGERWTPSIFMPRAYSRILLEITMVRVQRLNDISPSDAEAEGLKKLTKDEGRTWKYGIPDRDGLPGNDDDGWHWHEWRQSPVDAYEKLWENINGAGSWALNPWVWVLVFKML